MFATKAGNKSGSLPSVTAGMSTEECRDKCDEVRIRQGKRTDGATDTMRNKGWAGQEAATTESSCVCLRFQFVPFQSTMMANLQPELYKHGKREP